MIHFAELRAAGPFTRSSQPNPVSGAADDFIAVTGYAEVVEISRRPDDFCSGLGATSIFDMPPAAAEFFGSFINMDDPRHARQRGIVAKTFTPRQLQGLLLSVESTCTEVIDAMCESGETDLVQAVSQPFPLLVICDLMGIPRSEFDTVLRATNVILGMGDPDTTESDDPFDLMRLAMEAASQLVGIMSELVEHRRDQPSEDLTSALVHHGLGDDSLTAAEIASFFILLVVAGNETTRTAITVGMHLLATNPEQRRLWQADLAAVTPTAVEEIVRAASPVTYMRRTATRDLTISGEPITEGDKLVLFYGAANRDPLVFDDPERFDVRRDPNPHIGFGGPGPHFCLGAHLARRELAVVFRQLLTRLPDIEVVGDPILLEPRTVPLVGGVKQLPVRFTPTEPSPIPNVA
jgi:cytochrome P450